MVRLVWVFVVLLGIVTSLSAAEPKPFDSLSIDLIISNALKVWSTPGVAIAIVRDGQPIVVKGYGLKQHDGKEAITPNTVFPLGSCTKAFTSALIAELVDAGKMTWDDPVRKHLPAFKLGDPNADAQVTLRDLLTHRTGVASHDFLWYRASWNLDETIRRTSLLPVSSSFRGSYEYSTLMYMVAGQAAAKQMGQPWQELVRERITKPLGMTNTSFTSAEMAKSSDRASGHQRNADGSITAMPAYDLIEANPAGSMFTTAQDMVPWLQLQLADGVFNGKRIVSKVNLAETKTPHTVMRKNDTIAPVYPDTHQVSYAMGWVVYDHRGKLVVAHGGVLDGFRAQVTLLPNEKIGIVLLNNLHQTKMNIALTNTLIDRMLNLPEKDWHAYFLQVEKTEREAKQSTIDQRLKQRKPGTKPSVALDLYAAKYFDSIYGEARITYADGKLTWKWSSFSSPLEHFNDDVFRITEGFFKDQFIEFRIVNGLPTALRAIEVVFGRQP